MKLDEIIRTPPYGRDDEFVQPNPVIFACHPERSEGSDAPGTEILRCAQDDIADLGR
jgi:hypothetical protein